MAYLGIDPDIHGAAALISNRGFSIHDYSNPKRAAEVIREWHKKHNIKFAVLEKIWIYPGKKKDPISRKITNRYRSAQAINKLPGIAGEWRGILSAFDIDFQEVPPQRWQKILPPIAGKGTKERSLIAAREFFPEAEKYLKFKKNHGRSDALNMAKFAQILSPNGLR